MGLSGRSWNNSTAFKKAPTVYNAGRKEEGGKGNGVNAEGGGSEQRLDAGPQRT